MQTFLPYVDFRESARCLDYRRLGKQRVEAYQILNVLTGKSKGNGWKNHPAVKMWRGYEAALHRYGRIMCEEWIRRGYNDTMLGRFDNPTHVTYPPWMGDIKFHTSHKSNLLRKDSAYYGQYNWNVSDDLPYVWPTIGENHDSRTTT